jgi:uncharacterized protein (DUF1501 family)
LFENSQPADEGSDQIQKALAQLTKENSNWVRKNQPEFKRVVYCLEGFDTHDTQLAIHKNKL